MFVKLYSGSKKLRSACSGNIRPVQSTNLVSDWLKAENSPADVEEIKLKLDDDVARYFTRFLLFVDLWEARSCLHFTAKSLRMLFKDISPEKIFNFLKEINICGIFLI